MQFGPFQLSFRKQVFPVLRSLINSPVKAVSLGATFIGVLFVLRWSQRRGLQVSNATPQKGRGRGTVDLEFFSRLLSLCKIAIPSFKSKEMVAMGALTLLLLIRTLLSISIAEVNGKVVKALVDRNFPDFLKKLVRLAMFAIPASTVNSGLEFMNRKIALMFRDNLSTYLNKKYLEVMCFYKMTNLDSRITNPDQRFTEDINKWAECLSNLYSNVTKPMIDIVLFSRKLSQIVGMEGPIFIIAWYFISGWIIKFISPPFGILTAQEQENEGRYRSCHSDLVNHSEEIAFYRGNSWERERLRKSFAQLISHIKDIMIKRFYMGTFDSMLVKYGAIIVAYTVLGLPVFGPNREKYINTIQGDPSAITRDYVKNSSLLINLAKAIGRMLISYKDLQSLAGYTLLVDELKVVIEDIHNGTYHREIVEDIQYDLNQRGVYKENPDLIRFQDVPIISPNGDVLISNLSIEIQPGMHTFIQGPNGCGKSSLFRILGELWPLFDGVLHKPPMQSLFYIPQRPYLPYGTLRDQIIYPHSKQEFIDRNYTDEILEELLEVVHLQDFSGRRGGFDKVEDWNDTLSGGQKQKLAMCRLLYHKPKFAILDECTSAVSMDTEGKVYQYYKDAGITLITVSHRESLLKYHDYLLKFDGNGGWTFSRLV